MIIGVVNDEIEAMLTVRVQGESGLHAEISAQIDTGFSGALILAEHHIHALNLISDGVREATLADGQVVILDTYPGTVSWDGEDFDVEILSTTDVPLVGIELLRGFP